MTKPTAVEGFIWLSCLIRSSSLGKPGWELSQEQMTDVYWLTLKAASVCCLTQFKTTCRGGDTHSGLDLPYLSFLKKWVMEPAATAESQT